ncbi:MAG: porphobilinogen synthase [Verrucomicrobiota bacterium]
MDLPIRPRRNRKSASIRSLVGETRLSAGDLVWPVFLHDGREDRAIASMPGQTRWSVPGLLEELESAVALGIPAVILFPAIAEEFKTPGAEEAWNEKGLVPRAITQIKERFPDLTVMTDVALDPYNADGHDGLVARAGGRIEIQNDETVEALCAQALTQARAGADVVAPSDMMDGRVGEIRAELDAEGFEQVSILAYTAKYASAFYGPFRGALESAPKAGDKKTYQMDPANVREALREAELDEEEGADLLMVKPAGSYLDVIAALRERSSLPIAAYQVSGEYLMLKSASAGGWLDEKAAVLESLLGIKRAGADFILTYFAKQAAQWLQAP